MEALFGFSLIDALLVFARVGAVIMLLPGVGEPAVPTRIRLTFALILTAILAPPLAPSLPDAPADFGALTGLLIIEILIGLMIGAIARILFSALTIAGEIAGLETGLAFAQTTNPLASQGGQIIGVFLSLLGLTLIFASGLHHDLLRTTATSYAAFPPAGALLVGDALGWAVEAIGHAFLIAVQITAPLILAGLVFRAGLGVLSRLVPQIQVFFVAVPLQILLGFAVLMGSLSAGMLIWLDRMGRFADGLR